MRLYPTNVLETYFDGTKNLQLNPNVCIVVFFSNKIKQVKLEAKR